MKTILFINATYGIGSTGVIVKDLCNLARKHGWQCYVAVGAASRDLRNNRNIYVTGNWFDHKLHAILSRFAGKQGYFSILPTLRLISFINKIQPDIVHLHNLHSNYINLNLLLRYLAKRDIRVVVTLHDCWFFTGGCYHYTNAHCNKWQNMCGECPKRFLDTPAFLHDSSANILKDRYKYFGGVRNLKVIGVSNWIADEAKKGLFKHCDVRVIYNGVDMGIFQPTESDLRKELRIEDKFVILGPASKWLDYINNDALQYFADNLESDEVILLFGCSKNRDDLPRGFIQYGFTKDRIELASLYSLADVFVNLTHEESLSFINIEAQACGTRVLTYCNTGAKETVDGLYSKAIKTDDYYTLLDEIRKIKNTKERGAEMKCVEFVRYKFEKNSNYSKYISLYSSND